MTSAQDSRAFEEHGSLEKPGHPAAYPGESQPMLSTPLAVETEFAESADGSLVETIEHPEDPTKTLLAVYENGQVRFTSRFQSGDRVLVPIPRSQHIIKHVHLPRGVKVCESARSLVLAIRALLSQCLDLNEGQGDLLALFVLSTWFIEQLPVAPYVALVGLPRSGKTMALDLLRVLCRHALLTADITVTAFYRIYDRLTPTVLIDEAGTAGEKRGLFHLLRTGTTRGITAFRKEEYSSPFGAKVLSWTHLPDDPALNSRCLLIPFHETHRTGLRRPWDPEIVRAADELQKQFLYLRFANYKKPVLPKIQGDEELHSRARDLYEALALPIGKDTALCQWLLKALKSQQGLNREPLNPNQSAVLRYLFCAIHSSSKKGVYVVKDLTAGVNSLLRAEGGRLLRPREVGSVLSSLGFTNRKRTSRGWVVYLVEKTRIQIHELISLYGVDTTAYSPTEQARNQCDLCKPQEAPPEIQLFVHADGRTGERGRNVKLGNKCPV